MRSKRQPRLPEPFIEAMFPGRGEQLPKKRLGLSEHHPPISIKSCEHILVSPTGYSHRAPPEGVCSSLGDMESPPRPGKGDSMPCKTESHKTLIRTAKAASFVLFALMVCRTHYHCHTERPQI